MTAKLIDKDAALFTKKTILCKFSAKMQERRGHCAVYYNSHPKFIITFFIRWLNNFGDFEVFWLVHFVEFLNVSTTDCKQQG